MNITATSPIAVNATLIEDKAKELYACCGKWNSAALIKECDSNSNPIMEANSKIGHMLSGKPFVNYKNGLLLVQNKLKELQLVVLGTSRTQQVNLKQIDYIILKVSSSVRGTFTIQLSHLSVIYNSWDSILKPFLDFICNIRNTEVQKAALLNALEVAILENQIDVNLTRYRGRSLIETAYELDCIEFVRVLIRTGLHLNELILRPLECMGQKTHSGLLLQLMFEGKQFRNESIHSRSILKLLIAEGSNLHYVSKYRSGLRGSIAPERNEFVSLAVLFGKMPSELVQMFIDEGMNLNFEGIDKDVIVLENGTKKTIRMNTPLKYAIHDRQYDLAKLLVFNGASLDSNEVILLDENYCGIPGEVPWDYNACRQIFTVVSSKIPSIISMCLSEGIDPDTQFYPKPLLDLIASYYGNEGVIPSERATICYFVEMMSEFFTI